MNKTSFILILITTVALSSCKVGRFAYYNFANITDYTIFPSRTLQNDSTNTFYFKDRPLQKYVINMKDSSSFEEYLEKNETVAFLIIKNDSIYYENYFNKYDHSSVVASFSMAKSVTSILIGCAIDDGLIQSVNEPITNYIDELKGSEFEKVTLEHLLQMTSGLDFNESYYNPFGDAATFYYGRNLRKSSAKLRLKEEPETRFDYESGNTQLLGWALEKALQGKTISAYAEEKLWKPLGMEYPASWSLDRKKNGIEKTFCCLNARAIDFAKIGRLYLNKGNWEGTQIVSQDWVVQSTKVDTLRGSAAQYQYQWWLPNKEGDFIAEGILGQYIFVSPEKNLIIVRLGKDSGEVSWENVFDKIKEML